MNKNSFLVITLGCKLNQLESESVNDVFIKAGYSQFPTPDSQLPPSVIVINTCTVTSKADQKARRVIRKALRDYPDAVVIVTGCYAQLNKDDILKLSDEKRLHVVNKDKILDYINNAFSSLCVANQRFDAPLRDDNDNAPLRDDNGFFQFNPKHFSAHTRSFLKIQDGCDKHCTYCKIRLARGKSVSLDAEEVLSRLRILERNHAEAVLTGVNISQYVDFEFFNHEPHELIPSVCTLTGKNFTTNQHRPSRTEEEKVLGLTELLDYLLSDTEKIAIRLSSLAPEIVDEKLCAVLSHPRIRPHFHLSIQSCSEKILTQMGRNYNAQIIERAVYLLRKAKDDPFLACDIITGFPGETETEFEETFSLCEKLDFAWIHVFPYSRREGTPAFLFADNVHESDVTKRVERLTELAGKGKARYVERWIGREVEVLIEREKNFTTNGTCGSFTNKHEHNIFCYGTSENYLKALVRCNGDKAPLPGDVVICKLTEKGDGKNVDVVGVGV